MEDSQDGTMVFSRPQSQLNNSRAKTRERPSHKEKLNILEHVDTLDKRKKQEQAELLRNLEAFDKNYATL